MQNNAKKCIYAQHVVIQTCLQTNNFHNLTQHICLNLLNTCREYDPIIGLCIFHDMGCKLST